MRGCSHESAAPVFSSSTADHPQASLIVYDEWAAQKTAQASSHSTPRHAAGPPGHRSRATQNDSQNGIRDAQFQGGAVSRPSIIAIAGSAGAIQALLTIVSGLPQDFDAS